jgi:transcription elongation GreA/GreB family factor
MSRAFMKEAEDGEGEALPDRVISPHANFVTARGLELLETRRRELEAARAQARAAEDNATLATIGRDLRYFQARCESARVVEPATHPDAVRFGVQVTLAGNDGRERTFRIVGEDEADPAQGLLSYVSPLARALLGLRSGDAVDFGPEPATILRLER